MKCLETRGRGTGLTVRRYEREDGTRFTTYEVPVTVAKALGVKKFREALATYARGEAARRVAAERRAAVAARAGWKATAVANDLNITEARVRQIRKTL